MLKIFFTIFLLIFNVSCSTKKSINSSEVSQEKSIILATTTSTQDSGLLNFILPYFTDKTGIDVMVVAVGTGKAFEIGKSGDADVLLVHAKSSEEEFISNGYGLKRYDVMYNDFVLIGDPFDSANINNIASNNITTAFQLIKENSSKFISRGDDSGTDKKEKLLWQKISSNYKYDNYIETGKGMGETLIIANEMLAYTLTDRATFLNMKDKLDLIILCEDDEYLFNQYGVIQLNPDINDKIKVEEANEFIKWIISPETQELISQYGVEKFGQPLFIGNN